MKHLFTAIALAACAFTAAAQTAAPAPSAAQTAQRNKMSQCHQEAGDRKGDERKAFLSECLKARKEKHTAQQEKMKTCNADAKAKALKGEPRKAFMKECLGK